MRITQPKGFTLIELMIVVAVIAILAAIAYPAYQQYVINSYRATAGGCLTEIAQTLERRFTSTMSYAGALPNRGCMTEGDMANRYSFGPDPIPNATEFTLIAQPQGVQDTGDNYNCGDLELDHRGVRDADGDVDRCW
ncbi:MULTISPECIES: type IV pilin protein [unclassified Thioalkalivibrio]|uniref:type IV pilin protein n=1 Tax=unclassified Thioalkalivibrio TaxID=2621013 RepID=UPI0003617045|nr:MULTISPECIES: type IV pilin protein [unclassified Thioalkalivibrio]